MSEPESHPHVAIARALVDRLTSGDVDGVGAIYADDIVVWRNFDRRELGRKQVLKVVAFLASSVKGARYDAVRITPTDDGFVQQHVLRGTAPSGAEIAADACLVVKVVGGRIARIDEYIDAAQLAPLMGG